MAKKMNLCNTEIEGDFAFGKGAESAPAHYPKLTSEAEKATSTIIALNKDKWPLGSKSLSN